MLALVVQGRFQRGFSELLLLVQTGQAVVWSVEVHQSSSLLLFLLHKKKRKVYAVQRHSGGLCTQRQLEIIHKHIVVTSVFVMDVVSSSILASLIIDP